MNKPRIAILPGDPAGIGPELIIKLLHEEGVQDAANILLVGDSHLWEQGARQANLSVSLHTISEDAIPSQQGLSHLEMQTIRPDAVRIAEVTEEGGTTSLRCLDKALDLALEGGVDGILFGPFNKASMSLAGLNAEDEHKYMARYIGFDGYHSEVNVLEELMTTRVTSHIALKDVAANINQEAICKAVLLAYKTLLKFGKSHTRIAVAALNPHAGDNGKFGREEIDIIEPAVRNMQQQNIDVTGPWPSDTVFLKARKGQFDAVVTLYHDQGQIAIKLMGFERGVTVVGGLPIPVATPAHGTAFDIADQNQAHLGATRQAFDLLVRMAKTHRAEGKASTVKKEVAL